MKRYCRNLL